MDFRRFLQFLVLGPVIVSLVIVVEIVVGKGMDRMFMFPGLPYALFSSALASLLLFGGLAIVVVSLEVLIRGGHGMPYGDVVRSLQTTRLVKTGPYRFSRNPMILGYALILSSTGLYLGSISGALVIPMIALLLLSGWIKLVEEGGLEQRFGSEYRMYRNTVPFLLPSLRRRRRVASD